MDRNSECRPGEQSTSVVPHAHLPTVPLEKETRAAVPTDEAAAHLGRTPQTLRRWACFEEGPLAPLRIHGRLAWPVAELRRILGVPK